MTISLRTLLSLVCSTLKQWRVRASLALPNPSTSTKQIPRAFEMPQTLSLIIAPPAVTFFRCLIRLLP